MGVSNPRDGRAERNRGCSLGSAQQGHPSGWKRPSTTERHIGFLLFLHDAAFASISNLKKSVFFFFFFLSFYSGWSRIYPRGYRCIQFYNRRHCTS